MQKVDCYKTSHGNSANSKLENQQQCLFFCEWKSPEGRLQLLGSDKTECPTSLGVAALSGESISNPQLPRQISQDKDTTSATHSLTWPIIVLCHSSITAE